jgi:hypothetical protein
LFSLSVPMKNMSNRSPFGQQRQGVQRGTAMT